MFEARWPPPDDPDVAVVTASELVRLIRESRIGVRTRYTVVRAD